MVIGRDESGPGGRWRPRGAVAGNPSRPREVAGGGFYIAHPRKTPAPIGERAGRRKGARPPTACMRRWRAACVPPTWCAAPSRVWGGGCCLRAFSLSRPDSERPMAGPASTVPVVRQFAQGARGIERPRDRAQPVACTVLGVVCGQQHSVLSTRPNARAPVASPRDSSAVAAPKALSLALPHPLTVKIRWHDSLSGATPAARAEQVRARAAPNRSNPPPVCRGTSGVRFDLPSHGRVRQNTSRT